jgi:hypothetical protein
MEHFVKIYGDIVLSSIWSESLQTKVLWITMLALADSRGIVIASVPGLAKLAGLTCEECETSLVRLAFPDPHSKSQAFKGRRIEECDRGWQVLNYLSYRELRTEKQERAAERSRKHYHAKSVRERESSVRERETSQTSHEVSIVVVGVVGNPSSSSDSSLTNPSNILSYNGDGGKDEKVPQNLQQGQLSLACVEGGFKTPGPIIEAEAVRVQPVAAPQKAQATVELARRYLHCRHLRLHGDAVSFRPSAGMLSQIATRMAARLKDGFEADLLVTLPALVDDEAVFMLKDPEILLRTDNPQGGKCHARKIEAALPSLQLGQRQIAIIRNIGTLDYIKAAGCSSRWWNS